MIASREMLKKSTGNWAITKEGVIKTLKNNRNKMKLIASDALIKTLINNGLEVTLIWYFKCI